jgi:hypothetical protein
MQMRQNFISFLHGIAVSVPFGIVAGVASFNCAAAPLSVDAPASGAPPLVHITLLQRLVIEGAIKGQFQFEFDCQRKNRVGSKQTVAFDASGAITEASLYIGAPAHKITVHIFDTPINISQDSIKATRLECAQPPPLQNNVIVYNIAPAKLSFAYHGADKMAMIDGAVGLCELYTSGGQMVLVSPVEIHLQFKAADFTPALIPPTTMQDGAALFYVFNLKSKRSVLPTDLLTCGGNALTGGTISIGFMMSPP